MKSSIFKIVKDYTGVTREELRSSSRLEHICNARHIAAYVLHVLQGLSLHSTGYIINRNHATVMHSCDVCCEWLDDERVNPSAARILKQIINDIEGAGAPFTNPKQK